jgi:ATP-dependent Clp protease ATP-binding subunit ClpB
VRREVTEALQAHFRPEFLNRIDDVIFFHSLGRSHIREIIEIQLGYLTKRLASRQIEIALSDAALDLLAERGFDPAYGARPLKRTLQRLVLDPLAKRLLEGELPQGASIRADAVDGALVFATPQPVT